MAQEAREWVETARSKGLYTPISQTDRQAFWTWIKLLNKSSTHRTFDACSTYQISNHINEAVQRGTTYLLSHSRKTADLIGKELLAITQYRHAPVLKDGRATRHQLLGNPASVQDTPEQFRSSHILLVQFDTDYGLDWMWGDVGVLQFWITPQNLLARRFETVILTMDGH